MPDAAQLSGRSRRAAAKVCLAHLAKGAQHRPAFFKDPEPQRPVTLNP